MKEVVFKQKSWHYWLATFGDDFRVNPHGDDICNYIRSVFIGTFWLLVMTFAGAFLGGAVLFSIGNLFSWMFLGYELHNLTLGVFGILIGFTIMLLFMASKEVLQEKLRDSEPGFVRSAYSKFKDKTCFYIKFK